MKKYKYLGVVLLTILLISGCDSNSSNNSGSGNQESNKNIVYNDMETIYFNPTLNKICDDYEEKNSKDENVKGCLKWYAYSTNKDGSINMILDHDIAHDIKWSEEETNVSGPSDKFKNALKDATSSWIGLEDRKDSYSLDNGYAKYTIDYTGLKARIISAEEIKEIMKDKNADVHKVSGDYINVSGWLFDRISTSCKQYGCLNNKDHLDSGTYSSYYWTSTAFINTNDGVTPVNTGCYFVNYKGEMRYESINSNASIRPVITIKK